MDRKKIHLYMNLYGSKPFNLRIYYFPSNDLSFYSLDNTFHSISLFMCNLFLFVCFDLLFLASYQPMLNGYLSLVLQSENFFWWYVGSNPGQLCTRQSITLPSRFSLQLRIEVLMKSFSQFFSKTLLFQYYV